jgi:hypothetical protein
MTAVPSTINRSTPLEDWITRFLTRHGWPIMATAVFTTLGLLYFFRWAPVVRHRPSLWIMPSDIWTTYASASAVAHGHLGAVYGSGFLAFPGILAVMAPLGALSNSFSTVFTEIANHGHPFTGTYLYRVHGTPTILYDGVQNGARVFAVHQGAFVVVAPFILLLTCTALFALDALAEELEVGRRRRAVLCVAQAVMLWPLTVFWGHPEDALAVALAAYALIFALRGRFTGAGWFFGAAVAVQPLVIVLFPLLLVLGGRSRALGLVVRGVIPAAVVAVGPLIGDVHDTVHALVSQPTFPNVTGNHRTLWTPLAPRISGSGESLTVGGGPVRLVALALAAGIGWWSLRWRKRPEMIVWAAALALALRTYTESVMTAYYAWPALAVGLVIAARASTRRFAVAVVAAVLTTVVAQWQLGTAAWWGAQVVGVSVVLLAACSPQAPEPVTAPASARAGPLRNSNRGGSSSSKAKDKRKASRTDRKRTAGR